MDRRNFFKLVGTASGGVMSGACGKQAEEIIPLLVPEGGNPPGSRAVARERLPGVRGRVRHGCQGDGFRAGDRG